MSMNRRRTHRHAREWQGFCRLQGGTAGWEPCVLVDVSDDGAGVVLPEASGVRMGERIVIDLELDAGDPLATQLRGTVRSATPAFPGLRVGMQFDMLTLVERETLHTLLDSIDA